MKRLFIEAHKMTRKMVKEYKVDYQVQFGLNLSYLVEEEKAQKNKRRSYGSFSKKQMGVIYAANKRGNIEVNSGFISTLYSYYTDLQGWQAAENYNRNSIVCDKVADTIDAIFNNDYLEAQRCINIAQVF